jgi:hypothetical protein
VSAFDRRFGLQIAVPREELFASRGVPGIELRACGRNGRFQRIQGVVDTGASRTLLTGETARLLGLPERIADAHLAAAGGTTIEYAAARVQFRLPVHGRPPVGFFLIVGVTRDITDNLLGSDFLRYFDILITPSQVIYLADESPGGNATS